MNGGMRGRGAMIPRNPKAEDPGVKVPKLRETLKTRRQRLFAIWRQYESSSCRASDQNFRQHMLVIGVVRRGSGKGSCVGRLLGSRSQVRHVNVNLEVLHVPGSLLFFLGRRAANRAHFIVVVRVLLCFFNSRFRSVPLYVLCRG
jgi:hypothetical protein